MANDSNPVIVSPVLRDDNPYYFGTVIVFPDGSLALDSAPLVYAKSENDRYYTVADGETLENISYEAYGSSKWWHVIAKINGVFFPFALPIGATLVIPDLDTLQINNL